MLIWPQGRVGVRSALARVAAVAVLLAVRSAGAEDSPAIGPPSERPGGRADERPADPYPDNSETYPIGHVAYGLGGAAGEFSGFRQHLDLSAGLWFSERRGSGSMFSRNDGPLLHGTMTTGLGASPTYLGLGGGYLLGLSVVVADVSVSGGPLVRIGSRPAIGGELRASVSLLLGELGLHLLLVDGQGKLDFPITLTLGVGLD